MQVVKSTYAKESWIFVYQKQETNSVIGEVISWYHDMAPVLFVQQCNVVR